MMRLKQTVILRLLCLLLLILLTVFPCYASSNSGTVSQDKLASLLVGQEDLPWDAVLFDVSTGAAVTKTNFESLSNSHVTNEIWLGPPTGDPGSLRTAQYTVDVIIAVADSPEDAVQTAEKEISSCALIIPEAKDKYIQAFKVDRLWYSDNSRGNTVVTSADILFVRRNVVCSVSLAHKERLDRSLVFEMAGLICKRIYAALNGHPGPAIILPPTIYEMNLNLESAWDARNVAKTLGFKSSTVVLKSGNKRTIALPAGRISSKDYMVPLDYVAYCLDPKSRVKSSNGVATVVVSGKALSFRNGSKQFTVEGKRFRLSRKAIFKGRQVFVPLSFVKRFSGKSIGWAKQGKMVVAEL